MPANQHMVAFQAIRAAPKADCFLRTARITAHVADSVGVTDLNSRASAVSAPGSSASAVFSPGSDAPAVPSPGSAAVVAAAVPAVSAVALRLDANHKSALPGLRFARHKSTTQVVFRRYGHSNSKRVVEGGIDNWFTKEGLAQCRQKAYGCAGVQGEGSIDAARSTEGRGAQHK